MLCKFNDDLIRDSRSRELREYMKEHPSCTDAELVHEGYCLKHLPFDKRLQYEYDQTTKEQRQQFLDAWHGGMTLGEAQTHTGITFEAAMATLNKAIVPYNYVKREAE